MRTYTEKIHAERVQKMLEKKNPCLCCPATPYYDDSKNANKMWSKSYYDSTPCKICTTFLGMSSRFTCPCKYFGPEEAIERTLIALEEKGYV